MTLRNMFGSLNLESTQQEVLQELQTQQKDALTDVQLRASPVNVNTGLVQPTTPTDTQPVNVQNQIVGYATEAKQLPDNHNVTVSNFPVVQSVSDDYALGEILDDQVGSGGVLVFNFTEPVVSFWVAVLGVSGTAKVDHYGTIPTANRGIPIEAGGVLPIPEPTSVVRVFAPVGLTVTVWGQRR